ncbi:hypothetical protein H5410_057185 [Solanum commersonii]|uniref:Uncharacterized protein n=1 Tax=Solanum commersonii TaxID=4109 RepID=A0A9J5WM88_SOLCO|nr:hypothetical protein H5410_057185 [Solanum commersonii]
MAKTRGGNTKPSAHVALRIEKFEPESETETMAEIDNYQDSSADTSDNVESSEGDRDSEESSRDISRDEDDPLSLPICRDISCELYDLATWLDEVGSFQAKIFVRSRMTVWIFEAFSYLGKYARKSLNTPPLISRLLRWYTSKSDNIVEGDPFKYKGRSTDIVHPYLTSTIREMGQNYMKIFKPYIDEVKDAVIDVLKTQLKGVTIITAGNGYLGDHNIIQPCVNSVSSRQKNVPSTSNDGNLENLSDLFNIVHVNITTVDEDLAAVDEDFVAIDEYFIDGVDEMAVDAVGKVTGDHVDEVVVDAVDVVADDVVAVDDVAGNEMACAGDDIASAVDPVAVDIINKVVVTIDVVAVDSVAVDVAGAVNPVAVDVVDEVTVTIDDVVGNEVACAFDPVTVDIIDEVAGDAINEVAEEKEEEKTKEKSVDDEEEKKVDDCAENSVDVMSIVMEING